MTSRTESCVGLVRSREVTEGACLIGLYDVSTPSSVSVVDLVECGMNLNQMDCNQYEDDSWLHIEKQCGQLGEGRLYSDILFIRFQSFHEQTER